MTTNFSKVDFHCGFLLEDLMKIYFKIQSEDFEPIISEQLSRGQIAQQCKIIKIELNFFLTQKNVLSRNTALLLSEFKILGPRLVVCKNLFIYLLLESVHFEYFPKNICRTDRVQSLWSVLSHGAICSL